MNDNYDVIVVGAGAAGLLAAGRAAELGAKVLVLEKMRQEGRKLLITGKGRCNITNDAGIEDFILKVNTKGRFLRNAFAKFYSNDIINLLQTYGTETVLERGGRYFPASNKSADVLYAILKWVKKLKVEIRCGHRVEKLIIEENIITGLIANGKKFRAKSIVMATGGKSYPATGSNGEGLELAKKAGHTIERLRPALVPLETVEDIPKMLHKLTLKNVKALVWSDDKKTGEEFGELTFMEFGLSGPIILTMSRMIGDELYKKRKIKVTIDLKPALDEQKLDRRLQRDLNEYGKQRILDVFRQWLPSAMVHYFVQLLNIDPQKECNQVSSNERNSIRYLLKNLPFTISGLRPFKEAIITAGGVSTSEINSKTMESKIIKGLFFAGEIMDLDAQTGGYNLQIAWSTGWAAGEAASNNC